MTVRTSLRIGTTENPQAAGVACQRAVARSDDGTLWAVFPTAVGGELQVMRSSDGGESFEPAWQSEPIAPVTNASLTIDEEGFADLVLKADGGYLYYRRGRRHDSGWSWSVRVRIYDVPMLDHVNAVAIPHGDEVKVHVVWSKGGEYNVGYWVDFLADPRIDRSAGLEHSDREIWLGTRERLCGPFDVSGQPTPCLEIDRATRTLQAPVWAGPRGLLLYEARCYSGRWKWGIEPRVLDARADGVEGSLSAARSGHRLCVCYGGEAGTLHVTSVGPADQQDHSLEVGGGVVTRSSLGVDEAGDLHVLFQRAGDEALWGCRLDPESGSWTEPESVHDGPVRSFSCEQHGGSDRVIGLVCAGVSSPLSVEVVSI